MRRKQLVTKLRLFENMLRKLGQRGDNLTQSRKKLIDKQDAAQKRFQASVSKVDVRLFENDAIPESKYSETYAKNMAVIGKLVSRIGNHRMNNSINDEGRPITKEEYIRSLLTETQSEISILEQEETILGYMAKLVALDALILSEEALDAALEDNEIPAIGGPADAGKEPEMGPGGKLIVDEDVGAVIVGFDRTINYYKIQYAQLCINEHDAEFIATNLDAVTHLTDAQEWAGNGSMVGAIK